MEKAREFQKNIYFCFIDYAKAFDCVDHNKLWKIPKEMGIPDHLPCLLRNLYASQEATVRTAGSTHSSTRGLSSHELDHHKLWKILKEMGIPDHLPCLLRNLYAGQEATVRTGHGTTDWLQTGKGFLLRSLKTSYPELTVPGAGLCS